MLEIKILVQLRQVPLPYMSSIPWAGNPKFMTVALEFCLQVLGEQCLFYKNA